MRQPVTSVDQNVFELGGHSLLALKLFDSIARDIGPDLPISTLFSHPTLKELAALLDRQMRSEHSTVGGSNGKEPWDTSTIIHIGPSRPKRPFFIVGGAGGNVNNLFDLAGKIGENRPVVGFQTRGILGHTPRETLAEIASEHIYYMRQHQPVGPYILAGYSLGAQTAYEMARQLEAAGQSVSMLLLIDTFAPGFTSTLGGDDPFAMPIKMSMVERLIDEAKLLRSHGLSRFGTRLRAKLGSIFFSGKVLNHVERFAPTLVRSRRTSQALLQAAGTHKTGPYHGSADLLLAEPVGHRETRLLEQHPDLGWADLIDGDKLQITRLGTTHKEMVTGKFATIIADLVEHRLRGSLDDPLS